MSVNSSRVIGAAVLAFSITWTNQACRAQENDTSVLRAVLRNANGGVAQLQQGKVYRIDQKIQLNTLCPDGVIIEGNEAMIKAIAGFRHNALLAATELVDDPYSSGVSIRNLSLDGNMHVGRPLFGNWKNATIERLVVRGGTIYQVNAIWHDSSLSDIQIIGNSEQTNNGFDCNLTDSTIRNIDVNMNGNLNETAFWLNGSENATVVYPVLTDGRTAFGLENCKEVSVVGMKIRGEFSFRVVNILPAKASEEVHLYDLDLDAKHVGKDPSAGVHFNATKGGLVARGRIRSSGPGIMLSNGAADVDVIRVALPSQPIHPIADWIKLRNGRGWVLRRRRTGGRMMNRAPVVDAGPDITRRKLRNIALSATVVDEFDVRKLKVEWTKASGPGKVDFSRSATPTTQARVSRPGSYVLRLTVSDGEFERSDEVTLTVDAADRSRRTTR